MGIFDSIKESLANHFDKQKEDKEMMERLRKEADMQRRLAFEEQYKINAKEVAIAKAKRDAARLSGLQKLRAENRARQLESSSGESAGMFQKFQEYTQKNIARREQNLSMTQKMQTDIKNIKETPKIISSKTIAPVIKREIRKPFSGGGFNR
jgi:hypothetical protein